MYIDVNPIIEAGKVITALTIILGVVFGAYKWYLKQNALKEEIDNIRKENEKAIKELRCEHVHDIKLIEEEACLHTYGILACLKGLQEKGCNGPVTEAIEKYEKYLNKRAHSQED